MENHEIILIDNNEITMDSVGWDNGTTFPDPNGASMALLDPTLDNSVGSNWQESTNPYGDGDFGTPGIPNFSSDISIDFYSVAICSRITVMNMCQSSVHPACFPIAALL